MLDYSAQIKQSVTMRQAAEMYGLNVNIAHKAICPFHADTNPSMHIYPGQGGWYCFVCNQGGDVIDFVKRLFGLSFRDAMAKLNTDFQLGLPLTDDLTEDQRKVAARLARQRRKEYERKRKQHNALLSAYHAALDRWIELDRTIRNAAPKTPFDDFTDEYADALKRIDEAGAALDVAECELWEFERKR